MVTISMYLYSAVCKLTFILFVQMEEYRQRKKEQFESMAAAATDFDDTNDGDCAVEQQLYEPNLFQLTEAHS